MKRLIDAIRQLVPLLPAGTNKFLWIYMVSTSALAILDTAALGLLALMLTPMIKGEAMTMPLLGKISPSSYPWLLLVVCALMILKAILALVIQWFATRRFASYEMVVGDELFNAYIRAPWTERLARSTAEIVRMADVGIANTVSGVVLLVAQPSTALITLVYLGLVAMFMNLVVSRSAVVAGRVNIRYSLRITKLMTEMVSSLKEITLRDKFADVSRVVHQNREHSTRARANIQFLGAVPQRVIEAAMVGGFVLVGAVAWWSQGTTGALSAIALFGVAGFRIMPTIVTFQSVMTTTANSLPHLEAVLRDINDAKRYQENAEDLGTQQLQGEPDALRLKNITFTYPSAQTSAVKDLSLTIPMGSSVGIVGTSGSGKSTLVDIILGLLVPQQGQIFIGQQNMDDVLGAWRKRVGYVPQEVTLFDATIAQNIALTWGDDYDEERVKRVIEMAQLSQVIAGRPEGINERIGERGLALSGGERLGIARALYSDPLVLVLDEATSALDTKTEDAVANAISQLHGQVTVISVAHRLSTIRHNDMICFMRTGELKASGTFEELVEKEPEFAVQAHLAGLA